MLRRETGTGGKWRRRGISPPDLLTRTRQPCSGFTLIELLVVVAVIGLVAALLLSAIQMAREAARRASCVDHLHQIGLAVSTYESAMGVLPLNARFSPHSQILPFLEQPAVYDAINFSVSADGSLENSTARQIRLTAFICPSGPLPLGRTGWTSYAANCGVGFDVYGHRSNGAFPVAAADRTSFGFRDFTDGTSTTAAFSEWCVGDPDAPLDPKRGVIKTPVPMSGNVFDRCTAACQEPIPPLVAAAGWIKGSDWLPSVWGMTQYNHTLGINGRTCKCGTLAQGAWTAGSHHPGGANVSFVDGHVSFVHETTSLQTWRSLGSRNGGEVVRNSP